MGEKISGIPSGIAVGPGGSANGFNFGDISDREPHDGGKAHDENILLPTSLMGERSAVGDKLREKKKVDDPFIKYLSGVVDEDVASKVKLHWIISGLNVIDLA